MGEIHGYISRISDNYTVTLSVDSDFDRKTIWRAISQEDALSAWLGRPSRSIMTGESFTVTYPNDTDYSITARLHDRRVPSSLTLSWKFNDLPENLVRISLSKRPEGGTEIRLEVTGLKREDAAIAAATWHAQMEFLRNYLYGTEVIGHALRFRRDELVPSYEQQILDTGAPRRTRRELLAELEFEQSHMPPQENEMRRVLHTHGHLA
ncbi:MAG: SRPBCC family protein [Gulosibacter sp.]|uniref:SRPBCC family protein n=1 Tax=Gulosibacter sp. TaxID=2817531 RepID=UPI003F92413F